MAVATRWIPFTITVLSLLLFDAIQASTLTADQVKNISRIISAFRTNYRNRIASVITYPMRQPYPQNDIRNKTEMLRRFDEVFDPAYVKHVGQSKPEDWSEMGWRGIMLDLGSIWLEDYENITAVNHQSARGKRLLESAIAADKATLPVSLRKFERPAYLILTKHYRIRIDEQADGKYRYMSWKAGSSKAAPDLIVRNGVVEGAGSGGFEIVFRNGIYTYSISINIVRGPEAGDASLLVSEGEKELPTEEGRIVRH